MVEWDPGFTSCPLEYKLLMNDKEIEEFRSEKSVKTGKSPEEIEKLTVDENLSEMDRACLLITTGQDVQKMCVIDNLPNLLLSNQMDTLCRVVPKLCDLLPTASLEIQETASKAFACIIKRELVPIHVYVTSLLPTVLKQLESRDTDISCFWSETVLVAIPHLPKDVVKRQILRIAEANGQLSMPVSSRQDACRIIRALANKFDPNWVKKELYPLAKFLCLDVSSKVRVVMCYQLNGIARALGLEQAKSTIFTQLIELTNDEELSVKLAAVEALTDLLTFLDAATLKNDVVPVLQRFCDCSMKPGGGGDAGVREASKLLGRICYHLKDVLTNDQHTWFLDFYRKLTNYVCSVEWVSTAADTLPALIAGSVSHEEADDIMCRRFCAYNFPAMVMFCGNRAFVKELLPTLKLLAQDPMWTVRRTIACGFHEVLKLLSKCDQLKLSSIYQGLLRDVSREVLSSLVNHLPEVLEIFAQASKLLPETRQPGLLDFIPPLLSCEQLASSLRQWRLHHQLLSTMDCLVTCMTSDQLYSKFIPLLFKYIKRTEGNCVLPVKLASCKTLCVFIRHIRKLDQRHELCSKLIEDCAKGSSYKQRLLFIDVCGFVLEIFSRTFFKENFFEAVLELTNDPIVNVRLHICRLLPTLKSTLKLPGDRLLLQKLEQTVRRLISHERDPDASQAIRDAVTEMDKIKVAMETLTRRTFFEADLNDQRREEEEKVLIISEEKDKLLKKPMTSKQAGKPGYSPLEVRKGSSSSLTGMSGASSPSPGKNSGRARSRNTGVNTVSKSQSVPSPPPGDQGSTPAVTGGRKAASVLPNNSLSVSHDSGTSKSAIPKSPNNFRDVTGKSSQQRRKSIQYGGVYNKSKK